MRLLTIDEAAKAIHRSRDVIAAAVYAAPDSSNHLPAWISPGAERGKLIFEADLEAWVRRNYERVSDREHP